MSITVHLYYHGTNGKARDFAEEMEANGLANTIRAQDGCERYEYFYSLTDPNRVLLIDTWRDQESLDRHHSSEAMKTLARLREEYGLVRTIECYVPAEDIPLDILYEDADVLIVNKPKGMVVHPAPGNMTGTLVNAVLAHCREDLSGINGVLRPGIVHRIDKNTTGALIVCKNDNAHRSIAAQLRVHSSNRVYRGIVHGAITEDNFTIEGNIGRDPKERKRMAVVRTGGKPAVTHVKVLERLNGYTYCEFRLETGRTHQIRVHMASKGHPLLGDDLYGPRKCPFPLEGQTLHALMIGFVHPSSGEYMEFSAPLPEYFSKLLDKLRK